MYFRENKDSNNMIYSLFCRYANLKWSITKIIATSFYKINCLEVQKTFFWKSKLQSSSLSGFISPLLPYLICFSFRQENQNLKIDLYIEAANQESNSPRHES
jgi:hypothetical protein